ncbi:hypothetical protein BL250_17045 [Erwinia sp. OLTSP20]|uniref:prepilin-type N-terminal cleavage/methylation domain-containing protein n=1 Tax=unclassified Erwinia TaxID=2622719 RepID=UPI000C4400FB|nr:MULTISPECIES: prepilin-type N-terminal cleavage/methylation domain-containing protein [unclassified Erwinia]PIJ49076.1 hypothetical protein BV501_15120 [Erwinia sp. OAMSP11]PIJ75062.1 hypothetical protein BK416_02740 [Erwinia sp. OLSSP12]PIJ79759.1 hypothetical protein BLD47_13745 [Erwinia sp. OLCASP19]PIJ80544.1 hypothetical protein BLD46_15590 [Erwinia sp. OLMTSP26]PIJ82658.1 hypothetical protein BLD49_15485 [Erwinia sp. OLMDSP33]
MKKFTSGGFSLPEMMIVVLITSVLASGGMQGWQRWQQQWHLQDSASQLRHFLLQLRDAAGWYNADAIIHVQAGAGWCLQSVRRHDFSSELRLCAPWRDVHLQAVSAGVGFYGRRDVARPGSFTLHNAAGALRVVVASRGRIRICPLNDGRCSG